ncbi:uncharacterized protein BDW47DRAFT_106763 [Aspergillus candidus]|uniref:Uncharacterized protein n=1 Tax=Aspergillus candidus TaxID=41067 RepID=A0A2I2FA55_ASPCN|nr:hypothetical protein BDW47DRAFT_106763 [Aspergillus candidus]PLB37512.1 hypothetical protein BDW47DRAFT_106763 [Aspergillus candidus]
MQLSLYTILGLALPLAVTASPLTKRKEVPCTIVSNDGWVKCRRSPRLDAYYDTRYADGYNDDFKCYKVGDCYKGNCTWDFNGSCYVNGYYTSSNCNTKNLPKC